MRLTYGLFLLLFTLASCSASKKGMVKSGTTTSADKLMQRAQANLGKPYKYGGAGPGSFDCSGFTSYVYNQNGKSLPRTTREQAQYGRKIRQSDLRPGDLAFFSKNKTGGKLNHVALVQRAGPGILQVIHSTSSKGVISENVLISSYWKSRILFFRRPD